MIWIVAEPITEAYVLHTCQGVSDQLVEHAYGPWTYDGLENFAGLLADHARETGSAELTYTILTLEAPEL